MPHEETRRVLSVAELPRLDLREEEYEGKSISTLPCLTDTAAE